MRCPACASLDDKVIDSRTADDGAATRRRRECLACGTRFTTYERLEEVPLFVLKRSGDRVPFDRAKVTAGVRAAAKNRPLTATAIDALVAAVEDSIRLAGRSEITSQAIGLSVLERLRELDEVAYLRFASVYKGFAELADFEREVTLLSKQSEPKRH